MKIRFGLGGAIAVGILVALAACGVPRDEAPVRVSADRVPYNLLAPSAPPVVTPTPRGPVATVTEHQVYFVNGDDLLVPFPVPQESAGVDVLESTLLARLAAGPSEDQRAAGMSSALPPAIQFSVTAVEDGVAAIRLAGSTEPLSADRLPLAVGQIVLTATSVEGVDAVVLMRGDEPVDVPLPDGEQVSGPVGAASYLSLVAPTARPGLATSQARDAADSEAGALTG